MRRYNSSNRHLFLHLPQDRSGLPALISLSHYIRAKIMRLGTNLRHAAITGGYVETGKTGSNIFVIYDTIARPVFHNLMVFVDNYR